MAPLSRVLIGGGPACAGARATLVSPNIGGDDGRSAARGAGDQVGAAPILETVKGRLWVGGYAEVLHDRRTRAADARDCVARPQPLELREGHACENFSALPWPSRHGAWSAARSAPAPRRPRPSRSPIPPGWAMGRSTSRATEASSRITASRSSLR